MHSVKPAGLEYNKLHQDFNICFILLHSAWSELKTQNIKKEKLNIKTRVTYEFPARCILWKSVPQSDNNNSSNVNKVTFAGCNIQIDYFHLKMCVNMTPTVYGIWVNPPTVAEL